MRLWVYEIDHAVVSCFPACISPVADQFVLHSTIDFNLEMGRAPCCSKVGLYRGPWTTKEDTLLINYIQAHGEGHWRSLPKKAGSKRLVKNSTARNKSHCMGVSAGKRSGTRASHKRKQKEDSDGMSSRNGEAAAKIKIYLPKATKVCPPSVTKYISDVQSMIGSSPRNVEDGDHTMSGLKAADNGGQGWASNNEDFDGLVCDHDSSSPNSLQYDMTLDDIFKEYQQLLEADGQIMDSFVDSLLA
ncbi:hypothetical protein SADUNF_Sadunf01G0066500 [Salix dunnii]|uniref:Myb-like domain-containing protein n=1 Tax=Salix dunnii TaxID=1413687 RepID=A0A835N9W6_9ROSI|nr:hypothetical protein SADUNF_Sadunf01G0066500 [Salix dunnii]